jgi:hypothetical protein
MTKTLLASAALLSLLPAHAAITVTGPGFTYAESFDSLTTSTTAVPWVNDSTLPGWSLYISTLADAPTIAADTGASNAGTFRSFGASGDNDRALGSVASGGAYFGGAGSGSIAGWIAVAFVNDSGAPLDGFTLGFDSEQWRNGGNVNAQSMSFEYGYGATLGTVLSWTAGGASFDAVSLVNTASAGAVDGNTDGLLAGQGGSVSTAWAAGDTLWLRWADRNDTGNDHGLAIDNLSFAVTAVPEPGALALMLAGLAAVGFVARRRA